MCVRHFIIRISWIGIRLHRTNLICSANEWIPGTDPPSHPLPTPLIQHPASSNGTQNSNVNRREAVLPLKSKWKWYLAVVMWEEFCGRETWCWWRWHRKCEMGWRACDAICLFRRQKYTENADVSDTSVRSSTHTHTRRRRVRPHSGCDYLAWA